MIRAGTEPEPYWNDTAENVIGNLIYFICLCETNPQDRHLRSLCDMVSSREKFARAIRIMQMHTENPTLQRLGDVAGCKTAS